MPDNPRVFISYSHQDVDYENKVLEFANKLRSEGIDAITPAQKARKKRGRVI